MVMMARMRLLATGVYFYPIQSGKWFCHHLLSLSYFSVGLGWDETGMPNICYNRQHKRKRLSAHREAFPILAFLVPYIGGLEVGVLTADFSRFLSRRNV
jgi:hypothetical protein